MALLSCSQIYCRHIAKAKGNVTFLETVQGCIPNGATFSSLAPGGRRPLVDSRTLLREQGFIWKAAD
ncbi:hypothetical protein UPYG_G00060950 [Umbra pygmaea]|uniref:Uncharacterized protein n=1 Tax=Umbra pygmaea TaxID=75934 RepID=A0ABD0XD35_UMBPY